MNIEQAKRIPLALILEKIGCKPTREKGHRATCLSPLRNEKTASFQVDNAKNFWYDFGIGQGGNVVGFVCTYLESQSESHTVRDALRWIGNMADYAPSIQSAPTIERPRQSDSDLILKKAKALKHPALIKYLEGRGISVQIASPYIEEVLLHNKATKKDIFALGFANEEQGYEIRNRFFKGCIGRKTISFIRGKQPKPGRYTYF